MHASADIANLARLLDALAMQKIATPKPIGVLSCACKASELGHPQRPQVEIHCTTQEKHTRPLINGALHVRGQLEVK